MFRLLRPFLFSLSSLLIFSPLVFAQVNPDSDLFRTLAQKDSLVFEEGFNKCNLDVYDGLLATDLEFYHDSAGISDYEGFFKAVKQNICNGSDQKPIRKLVPGTIEVFPLKNNGELYGAIQRGDHAFYIKEPGKELYQTSVSKFTHLWLLQDGTWVLKRVLSFNHRNP